MSILALDCIALGMAPQNKEEAIRQAGMLLVNSGRVKESYVDGMLTREEAMSTYLGNGVAIPHGMHENLPDILKTGISVVQIPDGVVWEDDEPVYLVIGIASGSDEHIEILSNLADAVEDEEQVMRLAKTSDPKAILAVLNGETVVES
ncbi:MAG: PTS sugar transporter subunit IIA [Ardenticatenaceae bacterium]|nr:PTS sugar transporter subunit IIA [Ardenticatenaceae bacterium]